MDVEAFLDHFGTIAEAPGGVDRLRKLILDLAVRGMLVAQDAADEPAESFVRRVEQERRSRLETGQMRGGLDVPEGLAADAPFSVPEGWQWTNFGAACINRDSERIPVSSTDRSLRQGKYDYYGASGTIDKIDDYLFEGELLLIGEDGANLTLRSTPIAFVASGRFWVNNHAHVIDSLSSEALRYLALYVNSIDLKPYLTGIAQPKLNQKRLNSIPVPLPPEAEQGRIAAKVDELMELCDDLEARQHVRQQISTDVLASSLDALTTADSDDDLGTAWSRTHANWETLTDHPDSFDALRRTILQLAVTGKLSEINAQDVPLDIPGLTETDGRPRGLPASWRWVVLGSIGAPGERATADGPFGSRLKTSHYVDTAGCRVVRLGNIGLGVFKDTDRSFIANEHFQSLLGYHLRSRDIVVASLGNPSGRACVVPDSVLPALNKADCFRVRVHPEINSDYIVLVLNAPMSLARAADLNRGDTRGRINLSHLNTTPVPLPPRAEQNRIVTKVQHLLDLCNRLQAKSLKRDSSAEILAAGLTRVNDFAVVHAR